MQITVDVLNATEVCSALEMKPDSTARAGVQKGNMGQPAPGSHRAGVSEPREQGRTPPAECPGVQGRPAAEGAQRLVLLSS